MNANDPPVRVISEAVGSLPPTLYQKDSKGRLTRAEAHPLFHLLAREPNVEATRPVVFETAQAHALLYGNAYLEIERDNGGRPVAMWNLHPSFVQVARDTRNTSQASNSPGKSSRSPPVTLSVHPPVVGQINSSDVRRASRRTSRKASAGCRRVRSFSFYESPEVQRSRWFRIF